MLETRRSDWLFIVPAAILWLSSVLVAVWDVISLSRKRRFAPGAMSVLGLGMILAGVVLRQTARRNLGGYFFYGLRTSPDQPLVTQGVYSSIRHPGYLGALLAYLGTPLLLSSTRGFLLALLLVPAVLYRIAVEENMLVERFGDSYRQYRKRAKKLIPHIY